MAIRNFPHEQIRYGSRTRSAVFTRHRVLSVYWKADGLALAVLAILVALIAWNRLAFDTWLARYDVFTQYLPWYAYLGERLQGGELPGWNPHLFSGTPFLADPQSAWGYLPAMIALVALPPIAAFKAMIATQLAIAALSTYVYARVIELRPVAALIAAAAFVIGPFLHWNTYCCLVFSEFAAWMPMSLLGIELSVRAPKWRKRLAPWALSGIAISQQLGGWAGEGWIYALGVAGAYALYRTLLWPSRRSPRATTRIVQTASTVVAPIGMGVALAAAGMLPRLRLNGETTLANVDYSRFGASGILNPPWTVWEMAYRLLGDDYGQRAVAPGGAVLGLALLGAMVAVRRPVVPFFVLLTTGALVLTLDTTPLHQMVYWLIPPYQSLHEHDPWRVVAVAAIGPPILAGMAVDWALSSHDRRWRPLALLSLPAAIVLGVSWALRQHPDFRIDVPPIAAAIAAMVLVALLICTPCRSLSVYRWIRRLSPLLVLAAVVVQPAGLELSGSWAGWPSDESWDHHWNPDPVVQQGLAAELGPAREGWAGEYLLRQSNESAPFRYLGYGGIGHAEDRRRSYPDRRFEPGVQELLVNGRPMVLGLNDIQGYNPIQLRRYVEFIRAINGRGQDYHFIHVFPEGAGSPLLNLLNVRYVIIDSTLPPERADVQALIAGRKLALATPRVQVYVSKTAPPYAWIVHDGREVKRGEALPLLIDGSVDPYETALIEGEAPWRQAPDGPGESTATVLRHDPEHLELAVNARADGLLIISEIVASGWTATVDGERASLFPTHHALRGVPVPAGEHIVELRYQPPGLYWGLRITGVAITLLLAIATWRSWVWWQAAASARLRITRFNA